MGPQVISQPKSFAFVGSVAENLSSGSLELPSFPDIVIRIRQALEDENCTTAKLIQLLKEIISDIYQTMSACVSVALGDPMPCKR